MSNMEKAIQCKKLHPERSFNSIAKEFQVSPNVLRSRINGTHDPAGVRAHRNLSLTEEGTLIDEINAHADRGTLLTPAHVKQLAESICGHHVGVNWTSSFLRRHRDDISSRRNLVQQVARLKADTSENRLAFYSLVAHVCEKHHIDPRNMYNVDESTLHLPSGSKRRRLEPISTGTHHQQTEMASIDHFTVIAAISAVDAPVPPCLIYPGKSIDQDWTSRRDSEPKMMAISSDTGYSNSQIFKEWLTTCFDPKTKHRAKGSQRLLLLNGHKAHVQKDLLEECWSRNIIPIVLPIQLSSLYQPLDVGVFGPLKNAFDQQVADFQRDNRMNRDLGPLAYQWFQRAWIKAAQEDTIKSAWAKTGIHPLDQQAMGARPATPEREVPRMEPDTPKTREEMQSLHRKTRKGEVSFETAFFKTSKAYDQVSARLALVERQMERLGAMTEIQKPPKQNSSGRRAPNRKIFDQERYENEEQANDGTRRKAASKGKSKATRLQNGNEENIPPLSS